MTVLVVTTMDCRRAAKNVENIGIFDVDFAALDLLGALFAVTKSEIFLR